MSPSLLSRRELLWTFAASRRGHAVAAARRMGGGQVGGTLAPGRSCAEVPRALGVRSVASHVNYLDATPWMAWCSRWTEGLGIRGSILRDLVVYDLRPSAR